LRRIQDEGEEAAEKESLEKEKEEFEERKKVEKKGTVRKKKKFQNQAARVMLQSRVHKYSGEV